MSKYIDLEKAIERLNASLAFSNFGTDGYFLLGVVEDLLNNQPSADVVEVRHAEWELIEKEDFIYEIRKCSACGAERFFEEDDKLCNFCPDCGAKMDGERREKNEG